MMQLFTAGLLVAAIGAGCSGSDSAVSTIRPETPAPAASSEWLRGSVPEVGPVDERPEVDVVEVRPDTYELTYDDVTGSDRSIEVEVRPPKGGSATPPVVVWSHGGSTGKNLTANVGVRWGKAINDADFVFVAIAHRGRSDESRTDLCATVGVASCAEFKYLQWDRLNDASVVFDWLEQSAANGEFFIDMDRLIYGGHSAGARAVMVMAGMDSLDETRMMMPADDRPAAFIAASPPGAQTNGLTAASFAALDRPLLMLTGDGDTTGGTTGADRLAAFDLIDSDQVMLVSTDSDHVGHTTFDLNTQPCRGAGGTRAECTKTVRALGTAANVFLRSALSADGLDAAGLVDRSVGRLPDGMQLRSAG